MIKLTNNQRGYIISITTFFILIIMSSIATSMSFLAVLSQKKTTNAVKSTQSYYAAEAGIEDALLILKRNPSIDSLNYDLSVNNAIVSVNIPNTIGASKSITSQADNNGIYKKIQAVCSIDNTNVSFYYGAEVGEGGLSMGNGSRIVGNVFSSGDISGSGIIDNDVVVSGNGHSIQGVTVKGNALAYSCLSPAKIEGNLIYVEGGAHTCAVNGTISMQSQEILQQPLPIPQSQIDDWKNQAEAAQVFYGDKTINASQVLGPIKITGNLTINNNATLKMTGTVYVAGNIYINNNATVKLDNFYDTFGGVLISDGTITLSNNNTFSGSGQPGSYLLIMSTNTSDSAISVSNNSVGGVFYTSEGGILISNNVSVAEATGYKIKMNNNSQIQYSSGIANIYFTSGPGAGWEITSWREY